MSMSDKFKNADDVSDDLKDALDELTESGAKWVLECFIRSGQLRAYSVQQAARLAKDLNL